MKDNLSFQRIALLTTILFSLATFPGNAAEQTDFTTASVTVATPSDDSLKAVLPSPDTLGTKWVWPWNAPNNQANITAKNWKEQFWGPQDPRPMLTKKWIDLQRMSDEEFKQNSSSFAQVMRVLGSRKMPMSRQDMVQELQSQVSGITDFAYVSYNQVTAKTTSPTSPDTDFLSLKVSSFTDEYIDNRANLFNLAERALASAFAATKETRNQVHKAREVETAALLKDYETALLDVYTYKKNLEEMRDTGIPENVLAHAERRVKVKEEAAREVGIRLDRVIGHLGEVQGATLRGADGGYMVWSIEKTPTSESIRIGGKMRHAHIVVEFGRSVTGKFNRQAALDDTARILTLVSSNVKRHLNTPDPLGTPIVLNVNPELQVAFDSKYTKPSSPSSLMSGEGDLPTFIAAVSKTPLEAAGPKKIEPEAVANRFSKTISPPLPSTDDSPAMEKLKAKADDAYAANDLEEALNLYRQLASRNPNNVDFQIALGRTLNYLNNQNAAITAYTKVFELAPGTSNVRTWLAELYLAKGDRTKAVEWIGQELTSNPDSAWAHSWLASAHLEIGDPAAAKASFQKAVTIDPRVAGFRLQNGSALQARELHRRALTEFAAATYLDPTNPSPYLGVASCYDALNENAAAIQWYERYLELDPTSQGAATARKALLKLRQR